jgi:CRP-like cAMP-binding protein
MAIARAARPARLRSTRPAPARTMPPTGDGMTLHYAPGKTVIEIGVPPAYVYKVTQGTLRKVRQMADGRRHVASFLLAGDVFGFTDEAASTYSVEAISAVTLVRSSRSSFEASMARDPALRRRLFVSVTGELTAMQDQLLLLGRKDACERMAAFLLATANREPQGRNSQEFDLPMNRADLADHLGLTIETVSRVLTRLRKRCIIGLPSSNHIVLLKRHALEAISAGRS